MATILVVDDDVEVLDVVCKALRRAGHHAVAATNGTAALQRAKSAQPALAIVDLRLPDIDGIRVLEKLRQADRNLKGILMTGYEPTDEELNRALSGGLVGFERKPIRMGRLIDRVNGFLGWSAIAIGELIATLDRSSGDLMANPSSLASIDSRQLVRVFAAAFLSSGLTVPVFMASAHALRLAVLTRSSDQSTQSAAECIRRAQRFQERQDPRIRLATSMIEAAGTTARQLREVDVARDVGIDPAHLGRLMKQQTGLDFRNWRLGVMLRVAARDLLASDRQVKFVAAESGLVSRSGSTATFERSFHRVFGLTPGSFRHRLQQSDRPQDPADG
jgi:CheY-like chemotaxis protein